MLSDFHEFHVNSQKKKSSALICIYSRVKSSLTQIVKSSGVPRPLARSRLPMIFLNVVVSVPMYEHNFSDFSINITRDKINRKTKVLNITRNDPFKSRSPVQRYVTGFSKNKGECPHVRTQE